LKAEILSLKRIIKKLQGSYGKESDDTNETKILIGFDKNFFEKVEGLQRTFLLRKRFPIIHSNNYSKNTHRILQVYRGLIAWMRESIAIFLEQLMK